MNRVLKQLEEAVDGLEREISHDPGGEDWPLFFQMLRSFRQFHMASYREALLLAIAPCYLLEAPYCVEEYVDPPRAQCRTKADFLRYSGPDWLGLSGSALTDRLPRNEFGYLHPSVDHGQQKAVRLLPAPGRTAAVQGIQPVICPLCDS